VTWRELLADAGASLGDTWEARRLAEEVSGTPFSSLAASLDQVPSLRARQAFARLLERRRRGEPLQHVLGHWSFRTLELLVDGRALVPRPETEVVAGQALAELERLRARRAEVATAPAGARSPSAVPPSAGGLLALDLGTGSGAIACALVAECPAVTVVGVDRSPAALRLAAANRARLRPADAERLMLVEGGWYAPLDPALAGAVDLVVANPPYLAEAEWDGLDPVVRDFDPREALVAGPTGLEALEAVVAGAPAVLVAGGSVVVEIAPLQAGAARWMATSAGAEEVEVLTDLAGRQRVLVARW